MSILSYATVQQALSQSRALTDAAEAHGTLTGALCAARSYRLEDWLAEILPEGQAAPATGGTLDGVFETTRVALDDEELGFEPLLPEDEDSLEARTTALGEWCHGFLYGLGSGSLPDLRSMQGEVGEILQDLTEITRVGVDAGSGEDANESAYVELVEFVRVGVQILFEELRHLRRPEGEGLGDEDSPQVLH
ncbi:MAG: UPF0149 family protein [Steroidobacteraceae bacterium]